MSDHSDALHRAGYRADCPACIANDAAIATDRASAERLRHAIAREFTYTGPHDYREARAIVDAQFDAAALRDTGPRPDSDCLEVIDMWRERALRAEDALTLSGPRRDSGIDDVIAALTSEDEIAHGEAWDDVRKVGLGSCAYCDDEWPCRTQRGIDALLARLSTPRTETPMTDRASTEGLREALNEAAQAWYHGHEQGTAYRILDRAIRSALRDTGPRPDSGIDVERLARAMEPTWFEDVSGLPRPDTLTDREWGQMVLNVHTKREAAVRRAAAIAVEYARLSTPRTETSE